MIPFKEARSQKGVTQREIERATADPETLPKGIDQATLSRGERGVAFSRETAAVLARYFGFPWDEKHFLYPERHMTAEELAERDGKEVEAKAS